MGSGGRKRITTRIDILFLFFALVISIVFVTVLVDILDSNQSELIKKVGETRADNLIENFGSGESI